MVSGVTLGLALDAYCLGWVSAQTLPSESQDDECDGCDLNERNTEFGTESLIYEISISYDIRKTGLKLVLIFW